MKEYIEKMCSIYMDIIYFNGRNYLKRVLIIDIDDIYIIEIDVLRNINCLVIIYYYLTCTYWYDIIFKIFYVSYL